MRWPWQRARPAPGAPTVQRAAGPPAESRAGWAFLPPLQRTVGDTELTSAPMAFVDALPTRAQPMLTGPLSHVVSPDAPSGVLDGDGRRLATPTTRSSDVDLALVPPTPRPTLGWPAVAVQRRSAGTLVGLGAPPADVPPLHAVPVVPPPDVDPEEAAADGEGLGASEWPAPVSDVPILSAPDGDVSNPSVVGGVPIPSTPGGELPMPSAAVGVPASPAVQRSTTPLVPATPAADRAGSEDGATFVELPARPAGRAPHHTPPTPPTVQRRIGLGAPLRAGEETSTARNDSVEPAHERPTRAAAEPAVAPRADLPLVQRSTDPSDTAPTESSPPEAEPPVDLPDQPAASAASPAPDPTPTTGTLVDLMTALPHGEGPRSTGDAPVAIPSAVPAPPVVARETTHRAGEHRVGEHRVGELPAPSGPLHSPAEPHPGHPRTSPAVPPLVQRASIDSPPVSGTLPSVAPPVRRAGAPASPTIPTTAPPVRPVSGPSPAPDDAALETAPLLQRSGVPSSTSPPSPAAAPVVQRSSLPSSVSPLNPTAAPVVQRSPAQAPVAGRAVAPPRAEGAPGLGEAPTELLEAMPLPTDPPPATSDPSRPGTPAVQRAPLLSVARAPLLASSPRPPWTLAPHAGRPAPVSPSRSTVVQRADVAPVPVSSHALVAPVPSAAAMPSTPHIHPVVTPPPSSAAGAPMPVQRVPIPPLPVQRVDAVVAVPAHPVQRTTGHSTFETDESTDDAAVQTLTDPPTVQAATPPEQASTPGPGGGSTSPFASASAADLDELARRLTPPLLRRVRGQLLVDRERRGVRVDL